MPKRFNFPYPPLPPNLQQSNKKIIVGCGGVIVGDNNNKDNLIVVIVEVVIVGEVKNSVEIDVEVDKDDEIP
ncbi:6357_t:CDS:2, partial [Entrophospora sp. SA101]